MDHTGNLRQRVETLEYQACTVERRLRRWRGPPCRVVLRSPPRGISSCTLEARPTPRGFLISLFSSLGTSNDLASVSRRQGPRTFEPRPWASGLPPPPQAGL
jgi:hypothetical protein